MPFTPLNRQDDSFYCCLVNSNVYAHSLERHWLWYDENCEESQSTFACFSSLRWKSHNRHTIMVKVIVVVCGTQVLMWHHSILQKRTQEKTEWWRIYDFTKVVRHFIPLTDQD